MAEELKNIFIEQVGNSDYDRHLRSGLAYAGKNFDGELEWIGTTKEWRKYEILFTSEVLNK